VEIEGNYLEREVKGLEEESLWNWQHMLNTSMPGAAAVLITVAMAIRYIIDVLPTLLTLPD